MTFDLQKNIFYPYRKPNDEPLYINSESNHPPSIIKQLPKMISKRVSSISSSEELFLKAKPMYDRALENSGFKEKIKYIPSENEEKSRKNRPRKITWFNPPFNHSVKSNVGKMFKNLVDTHFPKNHRYNKLFNKNNLKLSYSCMPSISQILNKHNRKILTPKIAPHDGKNIQCNCTDKDKCPLDGKCLEPCVVYNATVISSKETKTYIGCTEKSFKTRYHNHKLSFNNEKYSKATALSNYIWMLKRENTGYSINWEILYKTVPYSCGTRKCDLCLTEKVLIASADPKLLLNSRAELISTCRHQRKFILTNAK